MEENQRIQKSKKIKSTTGQISYPHKSSTLIISS